MVFAGADVALIDHLADAEPIAQHMREGAPGERDAADRASIRRPADLGEDAAAAEIGQEPADAAKLEVALKHAADAPGLLLVDTSLRSRLS